LGVGIALVVIDDFDIGRPFLSPGETDAPLVIDLDGALVILVAGGDKRTQNHDIAMAIRLARDL